MRFFQRCLVIAGAAIATLARADDGYRLWLKYDLISDAALRRSEAAALTEIVLMENLPDAGGGDGGTMAAVREELTDGLRGLLGSEVPVVPRATRDGALLVGTARQADIRPWVTERDLQAAGEEGFVLRRVAVAGGHRTVLAANREIGLLYGAFALLRHLQMHQPLDRLELVSAPKIQHRMLDHWDNLNRSTERGYAGQSIWEWFVLPDVVSPRYRDYARACASVGINGAVLNNVNADALMLTAPYLAKAAAIARALRPYGMRVFFSARFSAPIEIGGLKTADPLDREVIAWWRDKAAEIYRAIPDFGGFLVKANSEGQPGPQNYRRTHADGANLLAAAIAEKGGIVIWRAFVYDSNVPDDRAKQAVNEFKPLDGQFRDNVLVQVKNGPIDFMPREPFHPLFGAMPHTPLALEVQVTQEYLGQGTQLAFLAPMWQEVLAADTYAAGAGSTVGRVVDGSLDAHRLSAIAGVANIGSDRDWCGHPLHAANWYAFGRLAWDHSLSAATIADEWTRQSFGDDPRVVRAITSMLLASREAVVDYSMPLGLHHLMATGHHYGPGPWVDNLRPDWTPVYYHRADAQGLGFDRTATGSNALAQYAPEARQRWADLATCPDESLLWFHHVAWDYRLRSGRTLWDELCLHYQRGVEAVRGWQKTWDTLAGAVDAERFAHVQGLLRRQEHDAREWRDACIQYFQTFSRLPPPTGIDAPEHPLEYYKTDRVHYPPGWSAGK
jgi:alpha-glucuronidase